MVDLHYNVYIYIYIYIYTYIFITDSVADLENKLWRPPRWFGTYGQFDHQFGLLNFDFAHVGFLGSHQGVCKLCPCGFSTAVHISNMREKFIQKESNTKNEKLCN